MNAPNLPFNVSKKDSILNRAWIQFPILIIISLAIHALVLKFIFPGYYSPLYPHHSDFYISVDQAHSGGDLLTWDIFKTPRPLGSFIGRLGGYFGIHGYILMTILTVIVNVGITGIFFRQLLNIDFKWPFVLAFCLYNCLLFSQPYFYVFYSHDNFAHYTYFFLLTGTWLFYIFQAKNKVLAYLLLGIFAIIAFLCKETYALSALFLAFLWFLYNRKQSIVNALAPGLVIGAAIVAVVIFNTTINSTFTNFKNGASDAYYINLSPRSIIRELWHYFLEGTNAFTWLLVAVFAYLAITNLRVNKKLSFLIIGCLGATFFSWLPNSLIPNHHVSGYSFNGAYLLFLPVLYFPILFAQKPAFRWATIALLIMGFCSPGLNKKEYNNCMWTLSMETTQRNILHALDTLMTDLNPGNPNLKILVTGLNMPFYPFHHPGFLREYPNSQYAVYDVINWGIIPDTSRQAGVKFITPAETRIQPYDVAWLFSDQGVLLKRVVLTDSIKNIITKQNLLEIVISPDEVKIRQLPF
jgi:hypothetical protein